MSRRRNLDREQQAGCTWARCDHETRDGGFVCDCCLDSLAAGLRDLTRSTTDRPETTLGRVGWCEWPRALEQRPSLWDDLCSVVAGEQGIDYATLGGGGPSDETGIVLPERAAQIKADLVKAVRALVEDCRQYRVENTGPHGWSPRSTDLVPAMAEWLLWRVDAIAWHPVVAQTAERAARALDDAVWVVDRPGARQQLGDCPVDGCDGWLSAAPGATFARCNRDDHAVEAQPLRDEKLAELEDRLCTAAEIARLSTYLGLRLDREQVRKRVNDWAYRDQITKHPGIRTAEQIKAQVEPDPRFRFGEVYTRLLALEGRSNTTTQHDDSKGA